MLQESKRRLPTGLLSLCVEEARRKQRATRLLTKLFRSWGYEQIIPPSISYASALDNERLDGGDSLRLSTRSNEELRLRSDITIAVSRSVAHHYHLTDMPLRLYYMENVFQDIVPGSGHLREKTQAGIEFFGGGSQAQWEIVLLADLSLGLVLPHAYRIVISHIDLLFPFLADLSDHSTLSVNEIRNLVRNRDFVGLQELGESVKWSYQEIFQEMIAKFGKNEALKEIEDRLREVKGIDLSISFAALKELQKLYSYLQDNRLDQNVYFDFGLYKNQNYYTGLVMEGHSADIGRPVLHGGAYNHLTKKFGDLEVDAVGFALDIDFILPVLIEKDSLNEKIRESFVYMTEDDFSLAQDLRAIGCRVVSGIWNRPDNRKSVHNAEIGMNREIFIKYAEKYSYENSFLLHLHGNEKKRPEKDCELWQYEDGDVKQIGSFTRQEIVLRLTRI